MIHHQIVELPLSEYLLNPVEIRTLAAEFHRVEQRTLVIAYEIGVVRHPIGNGPDIFEQGRPPVVDAYQIDALGDTNICLHTLFVLSRYNIGTNCLPLQR